MTLTLYDILEISQSASDDEIRKAYKRKALETHPDRLGPNALERQRETAQVRFQKVHEAFVMLGDPQKRKTYDASLARSHLQAEHKEPEEQLRRMKDRMEWAQRQQKRDQERIITMRAKDKELKDMQGQKAKETRMTEEFLRELFALNPEWEERKKRVYQKKAQRERDRDRQHSLPT